MERIKLAICMKEGEYLKRLSACLLNHYRTCMEIHIFTDIEQIKMIEPSNYQAFLIGDFDLEISELRHIPKEKILYLENGDAEESEEHRVCVISKYEEVPRIVDAIGILMGNKESFLKEGEKSKVSCKRFGVYSLNTAELQLPFVIMIANILAEKQRVLVVDLQENSGLIGICEEEKNAGMEEVMVMADTKKYTRARLISSIAHHRQWDYIYPARNSECLCEADYSIYKSMLQMIENEMNYDVIILNFGVRFQGFFRLVSECRECFFIGEGNKKPWREKAFYEELKKREEEISSNAFVRIEMSANQGIAFSAERLADQWLWNEPGDFLRKILGREYSGG